VPLPDQLPLAPEPLQLPLPLRESPERRIEPRQLAMPALPLADNDVPLTLPERPPPTVPE
jgi:hypothetical protein